MYRLPGDKLNLPVFFKIRRRGELAEVKVRALVGCLDVVMTSWTLLQRDGVALTFRRP
jgi:hypothetical protein